jgi:hypothetical protein
MSGDTLYDVIERARRSVCDEYWIESLSRDDQHLISMPCPLCRAPTKKLLHRPKPIPSSASQSKVAGSQPHPRLQPAVLGESACDMGDLRVSRSGGELPLAITLHYR